MSVNYSLDAATASAWAMLAILFLLKGSIWKLIWREMAVWTAIMASLYFLYVHVLKGTEYEAYYTFLIDLTKDIPADGTLMFLLSYMTYNSLTRWSSTFKCLMWPENVALMFKQYCNKRALSKHDDRCLRRTVARYLSVFYILLFRDVSQDVRDMFPTFNSLAVPGILTKEEVELLKSSRLDKNSCHYWVPIDWIVMLVRQKYIPKNSFDSKMRKVRNKKETIMTEVQYMRFITEIARLKGGVGDVLSYDWVPLPLALFQSLIIFVYSTLVVNCFQMQARIIVSGNPGISEMFVESMSTLPFSALYLSFLRISQVVINPFGSDDDDFETQYLIQRHINVLNEILVGDEEEEKKEKEREREKEKEKEKKKEKGKGK